MRATFDRLRDRADATPTALLWLVAFALLFACRLLPETIDDVIAVAILVAAITWTLLRTRDRSEIFSAFVFIGFVGKGIALVTPLSADLATWLLMPLVLLMMYVAVDRETAAARRVSPAAGPPAAL